MNQVSNSMSKASSKARGAYLLFRTPSPLIIATYALFCLCTPHPKLTPSVSNPVQFFPAETSIVNTVSPVVESVVDTSMNMDLEMQVLQPVHFGFNSAVVLPGGIEKIEGIAAFMKRAPFVKLVIAGFCDERGSNQYNFGLGMHRAGAVKCIMQNCGVEAKRIRCVSYGKSNPVRLGCLEEDCHAENRRVEFRVEPDGDK